MVRRLVFVVLFALSLGAAGGALAEPQRLSAGDAHRKAAAGELILIDIRSPQEWAATGVGVPATPISMHRPGFLDKLATATGGDKSKPVAVICAVGGRSSAIAPRLEQAGYTRVYNVVEGMLGGPNGPGWIPSGLPVRPYRAGP